MKVVNAKICSNIIPFRGDDVNKSTINQSVYTSRRLNNIGLKRESAEDYMNFLCGEIDELKTALKNKDSDNMEEELGDILFDTVMLADYYNINPEKALERTNKKINDRLDMINKLSSKPLIEYPFEERIKFWKQAKIEITKQNK